MTIAIQRIRDALAPGYTVDRELGRGGWATVYLALDAKHDRMVALKVLHPELAASLGPERFLQEIRIVARLSHPRILPLFDSGEIDGLVYYVMPYVEGETLRQRLGREDMPIDDAIRFARAIASALDYAHRQNIVHRDIKPENVMLLEGEAMVMDFGIAKAASAASGDGAELTQTGMMMGTPAYVSPEQAAGDKQIDGRSDQYSLACLLYEMLTGAKPFLGDTAMEVLTKRFTQQAVAVRELRATIPEHVERAVAKAMALDPAQRFDTVALFADALRASNALSPADAVLAHRNVSAAKSVAVLPFANMSADPDNEFFTDGIAEEIINALTRVQSLRVAPRTSSFALKGKNDDIGEIGRKLRVSTVLEGSVRKSGNKLRISAQLVNVADGSHLWSERYDRELEDVFAIQDDISQAIVRALRVILTEGEKKAIEKPRASSVKAYEFYLRGRQYFNQWNGKALEFARQMFLRAIEIDPEYAIAYAGQADSCSVLYSYWDASARNMEEADRASTIALGLAPDLAEAHVARGNAILLRKQYEAAAREFEIAMRLDPLLYDAPFFHGRALKSLGRLEEAARMFEQAIAIRPEDFVAQGFLAAVLTEMGRTDEGDAVLLHSMRLIEERLDLNPDDARAINLGASILAGLGERERTMTYIARSLAIGADDAPTWYNVACAYALLGMADEAFEHLDRAVTLGWRHREWLEHDTDFALIRELPRFQEILRSL